MEYPCTKQEPALNLLILNVVIVLLVGTDEEVIKKRV